MLVAMAMAATIAAQPGKDTSSKPWELAYYRVRATVGAQCRYADGSRAILLRTSDPRKAGFIFTGWLLPQPEVIPVEVEQSGEFNFEAGGGVTTYHSIRLAVSHLMTQSETPVQAHRLDAFLRAKRAAACPRKAFYADLYDKE